jgi:hypothetical protein
MAYSAAEPVSPEVAPRMLIAALVEHVLEQVAQQLHGHVLEGQRRAVGQFQDEQVVIQLGQGVMSAWRSGCGRSV